MGEIIKVEIDKVIVGLDDGSVIRVDINDVDFVPKVGDKVKIFNDGDHSYIKKADYNFEKNESFKNTDEQDYDKKDSNVTNIYVNQNNNVPYGKYPVNKIAYALLALLLGGIGAHKFYAKKIGTGILYLIFFWTFIPGIVAFIEFIIALTKTPDEYGNIYV